MINILVIFMVCVCFIVASWLAYNVKSLESKLLSMLLMTNDVGKIDMFLKLRKFVLKTRTESNICLDDVHLEHSDIIGILHSVYHNT